VVPLVVADAAGRFTSRLTPHPNGGTLSEQPGWSATIGGSVTSTPVEHTILMPSGPQGSLNQPSTTVTETSPALRLSVIVPIYNSAATLGICIRALVDAAGDDDEIIIADDGSTDGGCANLPAELADRVITAVSPTNIGRGPVRNLGVAHATGDVLVFVDSDVAVHRDALDVLRHEFTTHPQRMAAIGSYDDRPAAPGVVSQYRNLLHHHTHHTRGSTATHFWTGLGAVRRNLFNELGGLDDTTWARNMEDVEFGHRIVDSGYTIDVLPDVEGTHHKSLTIASMVRVDLFDRAIPWSTLMLRQGLRPDPFVVSPTQAAAAAAAGITITALVLAPFSRAGRALMALASLAFIGVNARLLAFFARTRGLGFAVAAVPLHIVHTAVSALGLAIAAFREGSRLVSGRQDGQASGGARSNKPLQ